MEMSHHISKTSQRFAVVILSILLVGCASSLGAQKNFVEDVKPYIQQGNWEKAYRALEDAFGSNESTVRLASYDLIVANPELKSAAFETFSKKSLLKTFSDFDPFTASELEGVRLKWYAKFASDFEILKAQSNLDFIYFEAKKRSSSLTEARRAGFDGLIVDESIFGQLVEVDKNKFRTIYPGIQVIPFGSVGVIRNYQLIDKSTTGSNVGSQFGSSVAQAAYIDKSFSRYNYSALGQLSAGLVGGLVGSSFNTSPTSRYLINYSVELQDGTIKGVLKLSADGIAAPTGQCVFTNDIQEAPRYLCSDDISSFIERAKQQVLAGGEAEASKIKDKINCKIDIIGTIKLDREICRKSNGISVQ